MPQLAKVLTTDDLARGPAARVLDLGSYFALLDAVREQGGVGAMLTLGEGESQCTPRQMMVSTGGPFV